MSQDPNPAALGERERAYWSERLAGRPPALELPCARRARPGRRRARLAFKPSRALTRALEEGARQAGLAPSDALVAVLGALLWRTTRQEPLLVGLREGGCYAAVRFALDGRTTARELFQATRRELEAARAHALPLARLLETARATRADGLFQVLVTSDEPGPREPLEHDLLLVLPAGRPARAWLHHGERIDARVAARLLGHLETLLAAALAEPGRALGGLPLLTAAERRTILHDWNDTATDFPESLCLHQLVEQRVRRVPEATAVVCDGRQLGYAALDARANALARHLADLGVGPSVVVGIAAERSFELVIGLLAIAKAGGAYLPLDPAYPRERLAYMLDDSGVGVILTQRRLLQQLPEPRAAVRLVLLDEPRAAADAPASAVGPHDLAYVLYTSGSTGMPKAVELDHRGRVNNFLDFDRRFAVSTGDAVLALSSPSFDMCAYDVFGTLAAGATIVLPRPDERADPRAWAELMRRQRVTIWHSAPAMLRMLVEACEGARAPAPEALRLALLGGDWIPLSLPERLRELVPDCRVIALGGATECSMDSTLYEVEDVDPAWRSIPYGKPMANQRAYVLDEGGEPVPVLVPGELFLGGVGVGRGYRGRPELTAQRFVPDPFARGPGARMYRTGDLARWLEDGNLELLGRADQQVKVRGFRIELGEVEARLRAHPAVREAVVVARADAAGEKRLVAYWVPRADAERAAGAHEPQPSAADLRRTLAAELPDYMVPRLYVRLEALPLSPNGKVDRKRLPEPAAGRPEHLGEYRAPRDVVEEVVAGMWADVLALEAVGVDDPFLDLGGHSILAAQLQTRLAEVFPFDVALRELFEARTVAGLCARLRALAGAERVELDEICRTLRELSALSEEEVRARLASSA